MLRKNRRRAVSLSLGEPGVVDIDILLQETRCRLYRARKAELIRHYLGALRPDRVGAKIRFHVITTVVACVLVMGMLGSSSPTDRQSEGHAVLPAEARIDINSATVEEMLTMPGMTRTWAGRIVRFRPYHSKDDLVLRGVVTNEVYARIKDCIVAHRSKE